MPETKKQSERLIVLLLLGGLAVNYPFLVLFNKNVFWLGVPLLYLYLFLFWGVFIVLLAAILRKRPGPKPGKNAVPSGKKG